MKIIRGFLVFVVGVALANGIESAWAVGDIHQPAVSYFALVAVFVAALGIYDLITAPLVSKIRQRVQQRVMGLVA